MPVSHSAGDQSKRAVAVRSNSQRGAEVPDDQTERRREAVYRIEDLDVA